MKQTRDNLAIPTPARDAAQVAARRSPALNQRNQRGLKLLAWPLAGSVRSRIVPHLLIRRLGIEQLVGRHRVLSGAAPFAFAPVYAPRWVHRPRRRLEARFSMPRQTDQVAPPLDFVPEPPPMPTEDGQLEAAVDDTALLARELRHQPMLDTLTTRASRRSPVYDIRSLVPSIATRGSTRPSTSALPQRSASVRPLVARLPNTDSNPLLPVTIQPSALDPAFVVQEEKSVEADGAPVAHAQRPGEARGDVVALLPPPNQAETHSMGTPSGAHPMPGATTPNIASTALDPTIAALPHIARGVFGKSLANVLGPLRLPLLEHVRASNIDRPLFQGSRVRELETQNRGSRRTAYSINSNQQMVTHHSSLVTRLAFDAAHHTSEQLKHNTQPLAPADQRTADAVDTPINHHESMHLSATMSNRSSVADDYPEFVDRSPLTNRHPSQSNHHASQSNHHASQVDRHPSKVDRHPSQSNRHPSQINRHASQVDRHPSQINHPSSIIRRQSSVVNRPSSTIRRQMSVAARPLSSELRAHFEGIGWRFRADTQASDGGTRPAHLAATARRLMDRQGEALPSEARATMEQALGVELGDVRVHTHAEAAELTRELRADAATLGNDVFFGAGQARFDTVEGLALLGHELTHVAQARGATPALRPLAEPQPFSAAPAALAHHDEAEALNVERNLRSVLAAARPAMPLLAAPIVGDRVQGTEFGGQGTGVKVLHSAWSLPQQETRLLQVWRQRQATEPLVSSVKARTINKLHALPRSRPTLKPWRVTYMSGCASG